MSDTTPSLEPKRSVSTPILCSMQLDRRDISAFIARQIHSLGDDDLRHGRHVYQKTCGKCHRMFDDGAQIGPNLMGSNQANLDYILGNAIDPGSEIAIDYQLSVVATVQGRVLNGIVRERNEQRIVIQSHTEQLIIPLADIEKEKLSPLSMMPDGQLDKLSEREVRDLIRYLASPVQVPLPLQKN